ncbi:unnamed protein product [Urochloa decumbens]|uniref:Uncharacterized protein n=1 Tax=Urochloa decumbens TaxID=240449 RepID=A0ABC8W344_9POAL
MAGSSSAASKFTVRRRQAVLVAPAAPTPRELKRLSDIDDSDTLRLQIRTIYFYRRNEAMAAGKDPVRVIKDAVARALVPYYPFAGRLREHDGGKLAVDCTAEGVLFVEADADVGLEHFGDALLPPFPCLEELVFDVPGSSAILNTPLLLFQVTRLACGGFILAVRLNHTMADAQGLTQFLGAVAELTRGAQTPTLPPVWERELLVARNNPPQPPAALVVPGNLDTNNKKGSSSIVMLPPDDMALRSFFFGPREVAAIRAQLPPCLQERATRFDSVAGWLWKSRTAALAPDPDEMMLLLIVVNARGRCRSSSSSKTTTIGGIPAGYYGNAFKIPTAVSTAGELCANPVSYAVELVRKAKDEVDMEYMRSSADLIALRRGQQDPRVTARTYTLTDVTRARFDDLDFGWGKPVYGGPAEAVGSPSLPWIASFLLPFKNANGEDGLVVPVCLPGPAMDRLVEEMAKLMLRSPTDDVITTFAAA